jgi:hypothetical protein
MFHKKNTTLCGSLRNVSIGLLKLQEGLHSGGRDISTSLEMWLLGSEVSYSLLDKRWTKKLGKLRKCNLNNKKSQRIERLQDKIIKEIIPKRSQYYKPEKHRRW